MKTSKIFRNSISGFNKDDVLSYIAELSTIIESLKKEGQATIEGFNASYAKEQARVSELSELLEKKSEELKDAEHTISEMRMQGTSLSNEYLNSRAELERARSDAAAFSEKCTELEREKNKLLEKAELYDNSTRQIADVIVKARVDADAITDNALKNADIIRNNVVQETKSISQAVTILLEEYNDMKLDVKGGMSHLAEELDKSGESISAIDSKFKILSGNIMADD